MFKFIKRFFYTRATDKNLESLEKRIEDQEERIDHLENSYAILAQNFMAFLSEIERMQFGDAEEDDDEEMLDMPGIEKKSDKKETLN
jgi:chaperonin cofactor prefoldin